MAVYQTTTSRFPANDRVKTYWIKYEWKIYDRGVTGVFFYGGIRGTTVHKGVNGVVTVLLIRLS
jgi:hypothetical protein